MKPMAFDPTKHYVRVERESRMDFIDPVRSFLDRGYSVVQENENDVLMAIDRPTTPPDASITVTYR